MKTNLSATAKKEINGYRPQIVVRCDGMKPITHGAKTHFTSRADAIGFAVREVATAAKTGWIGW